MTLLNRVLRLPKNLFEISKRYEFSFLPGELENNDCVREYHSKKNIPFNKYIYFLFSKFY